MSDRTGRSANTRPCPPGRAKTSTERSRIKRQRKDAGLALYEIEVDRAGLARALEAERFLDPDDTDDDAAILRALKRLADALIFKHRSFD